MQSNVIVEPIILIDTMQKHTKIVATMGPASRSEAMLIKLMKAGVNVFRLNFSHGTHEEHQQTHDRIRVAAKKLGHEVAILQDLCGPKIRTGDLTTPDVTLKAGNTLILTTKVILGTAQKMSISYSKLPQEVTKGTTIKLHDGLIELVVTKIHKEEIETKIISGGTIKARRGVNVPGANLSVSSLTAKDKKDVLFGIKNQVDYIAFSFVRYPKEVAELKRILAKNKATIPVIAKIETVQAIENIEALVEAADGIMVARGDLAVEVPMEQVPIHQKYMISLCREFGKPVIVATQMLESMIENPQPTRAEVSDTANAVFDGADAVMLSAESAVGAYPEETVQIMSKICHAAEMATERYADVISDDVDFTSAIASSAIDMTDSTDLAAVVIITELGRTARLLARYRGDTPIIALTTNVHTARQLSLVYGTTAVLVPKYTTLKDITLKVPAILLKNKLVQKKDIIAVVFSHGFAGTGRADSLTIVEV